MNSANNSLVRRKTIDIALGEIKTDYGRFQPRDMKLLNSHVEELQGLLKRGVELDPPLVWRDADGSAWLIEGHHRVEAHKRNKTREKIRVIEVTGSEHQAKVYAMGENGKTRLPLSRQEKTQAGWMAFCSDPDVKVKDLSTTGVVSARTVKTMRKVYKWYITQDLEVPTRWTSAWFHFSKHGADQEDIDYECDEYKEEMKERLRKKIGIPLQKMAENDPCLVMEVVQLVMGNDRFSQGCEWVGFHECQVDEWTGEIVGLVKHDEDHDTAPF
ncbi:ParB/Srx family N-terminal domain-containing protein [Ruegeria arenilitoris]|uniref:ParB/Srx family N-terminal domain-containing protein n=1 Tax=Ruegeria arenilitoris TaxID=1173585 RepID=UPI00147DCEA3|nr:ParB/Srx family N-terminal domain-containing protein [Ruegeria arenilitoris]